MTPSLSTPDASSRLHSWEERLYDDGRIVCAVIGCAKISRDVGIMQLERILSLIDSQVPTHAHDGGLGVSENALAILPSPLSTPL